MSLSSRFLNLSIKEQICISIILLTLFCILVILIVCCSLLYEILNKDYEQKKIYFYKKYKQYMESSFYYQSYHLMQYEDILHQIQKQIWNVQQSVVIYNTSKPIQNFSDYIINMTNISSINFTQLDLKDSKENPFLYVISLSNSSYVQEYLKNFALNNYQLFSKSLFSNNIYDHFKMPGYGVPIMDNPIFFNYVFFTVFGFNHSKIINVLENYSNQELNLKLLYIIDSAVQKAKACLKYVGNRLDIFEQIFRKFFREIYIQASDLFYNETVMDSFSREFVGHLSSIEYGSDTFSLVSANHIMNFTNYYYTHMKTIPNLLFFLNNGFSSNLDIDFIPFYYPNMTLISKDLCSLFKIKQIFLSGNNFNFEEIYEKINIRESGYENCFIDNDLFNSSEDIKNIFEIFFENFTEINNFIFQGIFNIIPEHSEYPFFFMKYSYPNYNTLRDFQSEYLYINQVNFYAFASFSRVQKYVEHLYQINLNIFYFVIMIIVYSWFLCLSINLIIFFNIINKWTEPITKLQEAVECNYIKDDNIFIYKYDDIINELFITCKELLSGQINSSDNSGINNFNVIEKNKEKKIDQNLYKKNLIINNEIIEELIEKQQSTMDFSKNVKLNEINNIDNELFFQKNKNRRSLGENIDIKKIEDINKRDKSDKKRRKSRRSKKSNDNDNNNEKRGGENESYIKLFKISEYLDFYRNKLSPDDNKNNQLNSKNNNTISINSSSISNKKNKNEEINENNLYIYSDENNITFSWYMEAKKKYNIFNYAMGNDCKELFTEYYDNYKKVSSSDNKKTNN